MWAPDTDVGMHKIIPTRGAHEVFYPELSTLRRLLVCGLVEYDPDYGPHARVYRPVLPADAAVVQEWVDGNILKRL